MIFEDFSLTKIIQNGRHYARFCSEIPIFGGSGNFVLSLYVTDLMPETLFSNILEGKNIFCSIFLKIKKKIWNFPIDLHAILRITLVSAYVDYRLWKNWCFRTKKWGFPLKKFYAETNVFYVRKSMFFLYTETNFFPVRKIKIILKLIINKSIEK